MNQRFLSSPIIFLGNGKTLENGVIVVNNNGEIANISSNTEIPKDRIEQYEGALCPGFVNTHCHLELSHLKGKVTEKTKLNGFIREVQAVRNAPEASIAKAIKTADREMVQAGIVAVGDISNDAISFKQKAESSIYYHNFIELFAIDSSLAEGTYTNGLKLKKQSNAKDLSASIVPHAPYSVSNALFKRIAETDDNAMLSIHNQETAAENELFRKGEGKMMEMLLKFGNKKEVFKASGKNSLPSYLSMLPNDKSLLLVHNTYTAKDDIDFAERLHPNLYWCFCPNANLYIEGQLPDVSNFINANVKITLGTDSLASNYQLSILEEMKTLQKAFPKISTARLIEWGCKNGAEFLGIKALGEIKVGKRPGIVSLENLDGTQLLQSTTLKRII